MVVSEKLSYTFVSTMKCATNTMYELLTKHYCGKRVGDYHCRDPRFIDPDRFTFTICRNLFVRAVSIWWSTCMRGKDRYGFRKQCGNGDDFEVFIKWVVRQKERPGLIQNQTEWQSPIEFDRVLHLKKFRHEFAQLPFVEDPPADLPALNITFFDRKPAQRYLTPAAVEAILEWGDPDFDRFGYAREVPALTKDIGVGEA